MIKVHKKHLAHGAIGVALVALSGSAVASAANITDVHMLRGGRDAAPAGLEWNLDEQDTETSGEVKRGHSRIRALAAIVGVSVEDIQIRLHAGESIENILLAEGVTFAELQSAEEEMLRERIAEAILRGRLTEDEADVLTHSLAERFAAREAEHVALENHDYTVWQNAVRGTRLATKITEQNFADFALAYELHQQGRMSESWDILQRLGVLKHVNQRRGFNTNTLH